MSYQHSRLRVDAEADSGTSDARPELSAEELEEIRGALRVLRALRALAKTVDREGQDPVKRQPSAASPPDEQYARAVANVAKRMKGRG